MKILGIAGSLRQRSYNRGLLEAALKVLPSGCSLEIFDLKDIPLYNQDHETHLPKSVVELKAHIKSAQALLLAVPEYNYSVSGVLKNALDWGSRPYGDNSWDGKVVGLMGASPSMQGTSRAQYHLRQICVTLNMYALNRPELMVSTCQDKFNDQGVLTDGKTQQKIAELLTALVDEVKHG